uniref:CHCH domain-containing protein n=1 Tax=viral metagenome TaxID=1070528 RepID=A0A6C0KN63_9ZZZZ
MENPKKNDDFAFFLVKHFLDRIAPETNANANANTSVKACEPFQKQYHHCMVLPESICIREFDNLTKCIFEEKHK